MRLCRQCKIEKPLFDFHRNKNKESGRSFTCKECAKLATRIWLSKNRERARDWRFRSVYGISLSQYNQMHAAQGGTCAICRKPSGAIDRRTGRPRWLAVDHCHKTGRVRGLLCGPCNGWLGQIDDSLNLVPSAAQYLRTHGAVE